MKSKIYILFFLISAMASTAWAKADLDMVQQLIMRKDYAHAADLAKAALDKSTANKEEMLFFYAESLFYMNELQKAVDVFYKLVSEYPRGKYVQKALLRTADAYYVQYNYKKAKQTFEKFLQRFDVSQYRSYAYLKLIYCSEKLGLWEDKKKYMHVLKTQFPGTIENSKTDFLEERGYIFVVQIGAFGDKKNAINVAKKVKSDAFDVSIKEVDISSGKLYKVIAGKFKSRRNADALVKRLEEKGYPAKRFP